MNKQLTWIDIDADGHQTSTGSRISLINLLEDICYGTVLRPDQTSRTPPVDINILAALGALRTPRASVPLRFIRGLAR